MMKPHASGSSFSAIRPGSRALLLTLLLSMGASSGAAPCLALTTAPERQVAGLFDLPVRERAGVVVWTTALGGDRLTSPLVTPHALFVGSMHLDRSSATIRSSALYALDKNTGRLKFTVPFQGGLTTPVLSGDRVLVGEERGFLTALDQRSSAQRWTVPLGAPLLLPPVALDDRVLVAAGTRLLSIQPQGGLVQWERTLESPIRSLVAGSEGLAVVLEGGKLMGLSLTAGTTSWTWSGEEPVRPFLKAVEGRLIASDSTGRLLSLHPATGVVQWEQRLPAVLEGIPGIDGDALLVRTREGGMVAMALDTGKQRWKQSHPGQGVGAFLVREQSVVFRQSELKLSVLKLDTGQPRWVVQTDRAVGLQAPTSDDGRVFWIGTGGVVYAAMDPEQAHSQSDPLPSARSRP